MKDIDFDELDRAVSSVLGGKFNTEKDAPETVRSAAPDAPSRDVAAPTPHDTSADSSTKKPFIQKRPTGRFMDVVVPSATQTKNLPGRPVSRRGVGVAPLAPRKEEAPTLSSEPDETQAPPAHDPVAPVAPQAVGEGIKKETLTVNEPVYTSPASEPTAEVKPEAVHEDTSEDQDQLDQTMSELEELDGLMSDEREMPPLDTPFVSDLAVEKRPLGAFSLDTKKEGEQPETPSEVASDSQATRIDTDLSAAMDEALFGGGHKEKPEDAKEAKTETETEIVSDNTTEPQEDVIGQKQDAQTVAEVDVIPEELRGDLVAIESREVKPTTQGVTPKPMPAAPVAATAAMNGSIQPQYVEKKSAKPEKETPIFDTTDYHQPLRDATTKRDSWGTVLIIAVLIIVGAGAGAAVYFFDPFGLL